MPDTAGVRENPRMQPFDALATLGRTHFVPFDSSAALAAAVQLIEPTSTLVAAPNLHGDQMVTPELILARLALSTPLDLIDDPFHLFRRWAALKYLGAFETMPVGYGTPRLGLSSRTDAVRGNQRRVFSEELGIGFAIEAGVRWLSNGDPNVVVRTIDVDNIIDTEPGLAALIHSASPKRPDYIQLRSTVTDPDTVTVTALESKGSRSDSSSIRQLGKASQQLLALTIGGVPIPGLASAAALNRISVNVRALQTPELVAGAAAAALARRLPNGPDSTILDVFTTGALQASWATQAALSGNEVAYHRWSPRAEARRLPPRRQVASPIGPLIGLSYVVPMLGGRVEALIGLPVDVDLALAEAQPAELLRTQTIRAASLRSVINERPSSAASDREPVLSSTSDGLVTMLRAV